MTSTAIPAGTASHAGSSTRSTTFRRRAAGISAIAAAVLSLAGILLCPWENGADEASYLRSLIGHPAQAMLSMVVLHYGYVLFVPVAFVFARLARRGAPKLAATGLVLSILGSGLSGLVVTDAYDLSIGQHLPMATAVQVSEGVSAPAMLAMGLPTAFGAMIGLVVLLAAMWRARWISVLPAIVLLAGWVVSYGAHDLVRGCSGFALVTIALVWTGARVLRSSNEEFEAGVPAV